jgi:hypothetical protein
LTSPSPKTPSRKAQVNHAAPSRQTRSKKATSQLNAHSSPVIRKASQQDAEQETPRRQGAGGHTSGGDGCVIRTRAGTVINDRAGLAGVAHIMGRGDNAGEEEGSVYKPSLSGMGCSLSNETDDSYVATNATTATNATSVQGYGRGRVSG